MKKTYIKPEIMFESFMLSTNIAGDCEYRTNTPSQMQCGVEYGSTTLFVANASGCATKVDDNGLYNKYCYHVFDGGDNNLFNS